MLYQILKLPKFALFGDTSERESMFVSPKMASPLWCLLLATTYGGEIAVLYDPDADPEGTTTLVDQGFERLSSDLFNQGDFYSADASTTRFDTSSEVEQISTLFTHGLFTGNTLHPEAQVLDPSVGFRFSIDLAIDSEAHSSGEDRNADGIIDVAGFSIAIISSDFRGIALNFWSDHIWASEDDSAELDELFAQAEGTAQDPATMATLRRYDLEILGNAYRLKAGGTTILTGFLRNYLSFPGRPVEGVGTLNNFDKPNSITIGDPADDASAIAFIGEITTETPHFPAPEPFPAASIARNQLDTVELTWDCLPGETYSIQSSANLETFSELAQFTAAGFTANFTDPRPAPARQFYKILPLP